MIRKHSPWKDFEFNGILKVMKIKRILFCMKILITLSDIRKTTSHGMHPPPAGGDFRKVFAGGSEIFILAGGCIVRGVVEF